MPQHDMILANQAGAAFRADLNDALAALVANSSGATEPATMYAYMLWADTTTGRLKQRNAANNAWLDRGPLDGTYGIFSELVKFDKSADIASGATTDLGAATGNTVTVTHSAGTTAITSLGGASLPAGTVIETVFSISGGTLSLTHHATNLQLAGAENIPLADKDAIRWLKMHDSNAEWKMVGGVRASGAAWASSGFTVGTPVTMATGSPTYIDFTGIPSTVSMIIVSVAGASTTGTSGQIIQLGDSGGPEPTGYNGTVQTGTTRAAHNTGFLLAVSTTAAMAHHGHLILVRMDAAGTQWSMHGNVSLDTGANGVYENSGSKTLSGTLDRIRWTTVGGTDSADGGTINIAYI